MATTTNTLPTVPLGATGLEVSALGLGAMHLSLEGRPDEEEALGVLHHAFDLGITFIDTADAYCLDEDDKHHNERLVRRALATYDGDARGIVVATKGGLLRPGGRWTRDGSPDHLRRAINASVEALEGPITLWQHHAPDPGVPIEQSLVAVREAFEKGLVEHVGVSNYSVDQIRRARDVVEVVSVQNEYSPWHRKPERDGVLAYCVEEGLTFLAYSPLGGKDHAKHAGDSPALAEIARAHDASPQQVVLAWLRAQAPVVLPIPGASRRESIGDDVEALSLTLSPDEIDRIRREVQ